MLAGNADRDRAGDVLRAAYAEGRLTKDEYDYRIGRALAARTVEELQQLTSDVPNGPSARAAHATNARHSHGQLMPYQQQPVVPYVPARRQNPRPPRRSSRDRAPLLCGMTAPLLWGLTCPRSSGSGRFPRWSSDTRRAARSVAPVSRAMGRRRRA